MEEIKKYDKFENLKFGNLNLSLSKFLKNEIATININNYEVRIRSIRSAIEKTVNKVVKESQLRLDLFNTKVVEFRKIRDQYKALWNDIDGHLKELYVKWDKAYGTEYVIRDRGVLVKDIISVKVENIDEVPKALLGVNMPALKAYIKSTQQINIPGLKIECSDTKIEEPLYKKAEQILNGKAYSVINKMPSKLTDELEEELDRYQETTE